MDDQQLIDEFIRTTPSDTGVLIEVLIIDWPTPSQPVSSWVAAATVRGTPSLEKLQERVLRVLGTKKYFRVCGECGERNPMGWMHDNKICQSCAERNHGVVY